MKYRPESRNSTCIDSLAAEHAQASLALRLKCELLTDGVRISRSAFDSGINITRRHLYDYGMMRVTHDVPYEIVLMRMPSFQGLPLIARVRYNAASKWELMTSTEGAALLNVETGDEYPIEVPTVMDFRDHEIQGRNLSTIVQRLGYDLLGVVPTNYCSYYTTSEKCAFCEIVETFKDEVEAGTSYRKTNKLILEASNAAVLLDPTITGITYNGGQLSSYDATLRMYTELVAGLRAQRSMANLDVTIACMPPTTFELIDDLHAAGLNQVFFNLEVFDEDLMRTMAPAKSRYGLEAMLRALNYAIGPFGRGRVYSNLVYGIQSLRTAATPATWSASEENRRLLEGTRNLLDRQIVPTYTVYHTSGRNLTGRIPLSAAGLYDFTIEYGKLVWSSGLIARSRGAILFTIGSLPNTTYNDGWLLAELEYGAQQESASAS